MSRITIQPKQPVISRNKPSYAKKIMMIFFGTAYLIVESFDKYILRRLEKNANFRETLGKIKLFMVKYKLLILTAVAALCVLVIVTANSASARLVFVIILGAILAHKIWGREMKRKLAEVRHKYFLSDENKE
ncbi:MAG: hypothetical protein LBG12_02590 [Synergistaceae bacterium]|nr:hypothetical protein [Synergistaceae bacterium]